MKVALVYDRVNKYGGAERVLEALHGIWPDAPLFTAVYDKKNAPWASSFSVKPSFLNHIPFAKRNHELLAWITPLAFETFTFDGYDAVISVTSAEAKSVLTKPETLHICYCLTPTRYLWSGFNDYVLYPGLGPMGWAYGKIFTRMAPMLRRWDLVSAKRPDAYIAISDHVAERIETYYRKKPVATIYPPVDFEVFSPGRGKAPSGVIPQGYFLVVSRMVGYKRLDLVIEACRKFNIPLVCIGSGRDLSRLKKNAGTSVYFINGNLTEDELVYYYNHCRAFVFAGKEDFGLSAVEAQACGKPVIAYKNSGIAEIVRDGKTGFLFSEQSAGGISSAIRRLNSTVIRTEACRENARRFSLKKFVKQFKQVVEDQLDLQKKSLL